MSIQIEACFTDHWSYINRNFPNDRRLLMTASTTGDIMSKVCTISFEQPVNYLCDAWHVFPPKYEAWTHFDMPWTEYQCQAVVWTLLIIITEYVNRSTCLSFCFMTRALWIFPLSTVPRIVLSDLEQLNSCNLPLSVSFRQVWTKLCSRKRAIKMLLSNERPIIALGL